MGFIGGLFQSNSSKNTENKMKFLIVGLGNMGAKYDGTRHNIGFEVLDYVADLKNASWEHEKKGDLARIKHAGRQLVLLKPSTYVNLSGKAMRYWLQKGKIPVNRSLVVVDDLNLPFGKLRIRPHGSHGGHNGLKDIEGTLNTQKYSRLRIGIGSDFHSGQQIDHVLGKWSRLEKKKLEEIIPEAWEIIADYTKIGIEQAMNNHNS